MTDEKEYPDVGGEWLEEEIILDDRIICSLNLGPDPDSTFIRIGRNIGIFTVKE